MASVSSMSSGNPNTQVYSYSSNGLSGLISGVDTETMVKKLLAGTQTKIDKQKQNQQVLKWKQAMYQSAITDINNFKNKYFDSAFDSSLATNLSNAKFFNTKVSTVTSGSAITINNTDSSANLGTMTFNVMQLATAAKLNSSKTMSSDQSIIGGAIDFEALTSAVAADGSISFDMTLDGVQKEITLTKSDFENANVDFENNGTITAEALNTVLAQKTRDAFGTYVNASVETTTENGVTSSKVKFSVNIYATQPDGEGGYVSTGVKETGHELRITGVSAGKLGVEPGSSSLLSMFSTLVSLAGISGATYSFSINGKDFTFSATDTISSMMSAINSSGANVKISYSTVADKFTLEASQTGAQYGIDITQKSGNLLTVLFGSDVSAAPSVSGNVLNTSTVTGSALPDMYTTSGSTMSMTVNGKSYTYTLEAGTYTKSKLAEDLNAWLKTKFGMQSDGSTANISYDAESGVFTTAAGYALSFAKTGVASTDSTASTNLAVAMGLAENGASNAVTASTRIEDIPALSGMTLLKADGTNPAETLEEIAFVSDNGTKYATSFNATSSSLILTPPFDDAEGADNTVTFTDSKLAAYFGSSFTPGTGTAASVTAGTDLIVNVNGIQTSRSSNTFTMDGLTITAKALSNGTDTVVNTERDTSEIVSAIKSFVNDYNELVTNLYGKITEDATYKEYAPLTDAQRAEMSESEITAWEKNAKIGLLRNDPTIASFLQSLDEAFYTKVESAGLGAYSIGIETISTDLTGKLKLDESLLTTALATDPDAVAKLFTDSTNGISTLLTKAIDSAAKLSAANPGSLVQIAGAAGWSTNAKNNDIYNELQTISDKLKDLKSKYDSEKQRYWNKFTSLETILANYQSQSAMLSNFFSN